LRKATSKGSTFIEGRKIRRMRAMGVLADPGLGSNEMAPRDAAASPLESWRIRPNVAQGVAERRSGDAAEIGLEIGYRPQRLADFYGNRFWTAAIVLSLGLHAVALLAILVWPSPPSLLANPETTTVEIVVEPRDASPRYELPPAPEPQSPPAAELPPTPIEQAAPASDDMPTARSPMSAPTPVEPPTPAVPAAPAAEEPSPKAAWLPAPAPSPAPKALPTFVEPSPVPVPPPAAEEPAPPSIPAPSPAAADLPPSERPTPQPPLIAAPAPARTPSPLQQAAKPRVEAPRNVPPRALPQAAQAPSKPSKAAPIAPQALSASRAGGDLAEYQRAVAARLSAVKHYPESARDRAPHGVAVVRFSIDASGQATAVSIVQSAGDTALDADALATVRRASPFGPPPAGVPRVFSAPLSYRVR
jgi:protein TonB